MSRVEIKKCVKAMSCSAWFPYVLLFVLLLVWHFKINGSGDDLYFAAALNGEGQSVAGFLSGRYQTWSSRLLIEAVLVFMVQRVWLWRVLNSLVLTGIAVLCAKLAGGEKEPVLGWGLCAMVLLIPCDVLNEAGWIATQVNYTWPALCALAALLPVKRTLCGEYLPIWEAVFAVPALLFAANQEQFCAALLALLAAGLIRTICIYKRIPWFCALELLLCMGMLVGIVLCPGNKARYAAEIGAWFPNYGELTFAVKAEMGYSSTGFGLIMQKNAMFLSFSLLLAVPVWLKSRNFLTRVISAFPAAASLMLGFFPQTLEVVLPRIARMRNMLGETGTGATILSPGTLMPDLLLLAIFLCVVYSLFTGLGAQNGWMMLYALCVGLATRLVMGFSPTIWASGTRTFIPLYTVMMGIGAVVLRSIQCVPMSDKALRWIRRAGALVIVLYMAERIV